ncbi:MAG: hypothetical protein AAF389_12145 [Gemmatimonadota bacterium]
MSRLHEQKASILPSLAHVAWATVFICGVELAVNGAGRGIAWFGFVYGILPVALAVSIPYIPARNGLAGQAVRLAVFVTLCMVVVDVAAPTGVVRIGTTTRLFDGSPANEVQVSSDFTRVSGVGTVVSQAMSGFDGVADHQRPYAETHPRLRLALAFLKLSALAVPMSVAFILPWLAGWIRAEVPNPVSATRAEFVVCWVGGIGLYWTMFHWAQRGYHASLLGDVPLTFILLPSLALVVAGLFVSRLPLRSPERQSAAVHHE